MMWRAFVIGVLIAACERSTPAETDRDRDRDRDRAPVPRVPARSPIEVIADKVVAAVAANDYEQYSTLSSKLVKTELGDQHGIAFRRLVERLETEKIELARAKIERVETTGSDLVMVNVYLVLDGKRFMMHFSVMTLGGGHDMLGVAEWIQWQK